MAPGDGEGFDGMTENLPLITIGICCYNSADSVARAVDSALAQDWPNLEVIVVDDGSSDNTSEVISATIKDYPQARLIKHDKNKRFPGALNTVIANARGEFIAIFDDDDASLPQRLRTQYKRITDYEKKTGATLVACWASGIRQYPNGYEYQNIAIGAYDRPPVGTEAADFLLFYGKVEGVFYGGTPSCSLMTRKSTYDAVGFYDESMMRSEDTDFSIRLAKKGGHFIGTPEMLVLQTQTGGAEKKPEVNYLSYKHLMEKHSDYLRSINRYYYATGWNTLRFHHFSGRKFRAFLTLMRVFLHNPILVWTHFWSTAPKRLIHEAKMKRKSS